MVCNLYMWRRFAFADEIQAASLQILEERAPQNSLDYRVQAANRFILKQMSSDSRRVYPDDTRLDQVNPFYPLHGYFLKIHYRC